MLEKFQAVVIGGGPGGYVCAIRLAQLGLKTACIESRGSLGGTCLNVGCIPSKSLLNLSEDFQKVKNLSDKGIEVGEVKLNLSKMMKSKEKAVTVLTKGVEFLLKKNKVTYFKGTGSLNSKNEICIKDISSKETQIFAENVVLATGSLPMSLPGVEFDEKQLDENKKVKGIFEELYFKAEELELISINSVNYQDAYKVKVTVDGKESHRYYSVESGLLLSKEDTDDNNNVVTTNYGDYQSVQNVMFPFYMELPAQKLEFKTSSVEINKEIKDSSF